MRKKITESPIERNVCKYAEGKGWLQYKFSSLGNKGVPDRIFMRAGEVFFIEFKATGKKPSKMQEHVHSIFRGQGLTVHVIDNVAEGRALFDRA